MSPGPSSGPGLSGPPAAPRVDAESDCASALVSAQRLPAALNALHWGPELRVGGARFGHAPVSDETIYPDFYTFAPTRPPSLLASGSPGKITHQKQAEVSRDPAIAAAHNATGVRGKNATFYTGGEGNKTLPQDADLASGVSPEQTRSADAEGSAPDADWDAETAQQAGSAEGNPPQEDTQGLVIRPTTSDQEANQTSDTQGAEDNGTPVSADHDEDSSLDGMVLNDDQNALAPGSENQNSALGNPEMMAYSSEAISNRPDAMSNRSEAMSNPPEAISKPPEAMSNQPEMMSKPPEAMSNQPEVMSNQPEVMSNQP